MRSSSRWAAHDYFINKIVSSCEKPKAVGPDRVEFVILGGKLWERQGFVMVCPWWPNLFLVSRKDYVWDGRYPSWILDPMVDMI